MSVPRSEELRFSDMCDARDLPWPRIGIAESEEVPLDVQDFLSVPLDELRSAYEDTLPGIFGGTQVARN